MAFHETSTITEIKNKILSMGRPLVLKKGETIFRQGDSFECLYVLCSGSAKTLLLSNDGDEQLTDFYFPNDIIGFSSIEQKTHSVTAITLELSSVYEISADKMKKLSTEDVSLLNYLINMISRQICHAQNMQLITCQKNAEQRVSNFLICLSARFSSNGYSPTKFRLSMSRAEMANNLGLTPETVSRIITKLCGQGIIAIEGKNIRIIKPEALMII